MNHAPFIFASYAVAAVVFGWCALAPVWRARRFRASWQARERARANSARANEKS